MFNLFFFLLVSGVYVPMNIENIPPFETFVECEVIAKEVVVSVKEESGITVYWICEEEEIST